MTEPQALVVLSTAPDEALARRIAMTLIEEHLAGCVNLIPAIRSIYRWEGKVCDDAEVLLICKTTTARKDEVLAAIRRVHTYACPEAIVLPTADVAAPYLGWLREATT